MRSTPVSSCCVEISSPEMDSPTTQALPPGRGQVQKPWDVERNFHKHACRLCFGLGLSLTGQLVLLGTHTVDVARKSDLSEKRHAFHFSCGCLAYLFRHLSTSCCCVHRWTLLDVCINREQSCGHEPINSVDTITSWCVLDSEVSGNGQVLCLCAAPKLAKRKQA